MIFIKAKLQSTCFETGYKINKGDLILYCPILKRKFHYNSPSAFDYERQQEERFLESKEKTFVQNSELI